MDKNVSVFIFTFSDNFEFIKNFIISKGIQVVNDVSECTCILAIGGDGTIIGARKFGIHFSKPIMGYNEGTLGFLSCTSDKDELVDILINEKYVIQERKLLSVFLADTILPEMPKSFCLNEITIESKHRGKIADIYLKILNSNEKIEYHADKIIFSTTTGSTAYNLSAGGPILHPDLKGMVITPLGAFSMTARSIVIPDDYEIEISSPDDLFIKIDNRGDYIINKNSLIKIQYDGTFIKLMMKDYRFFKIIEDKLQWNTHLKARKY